MGVWSLREFNGTFEMFRENAVEEPAKAEMEEVTSGLAERR